MWLQHFMMTCLVMLLSAGCGDSDAQAPSPEDGTPEICCECYEVGDACPAEAEELECQDTVAWCGGQAASGGSWRTCREGVWKEFPSPAGAPIANSAKCVQSEGEDSYCTSNGACVQGTPCDDETCCRPNSPDSDTYCQQTYGGCSTCQEGADWGSCSPTSCD